MNRPPAIIAAALVGAVFTFAACGSDANGDVRQDDPSPVVPSPSEVYYEQTHPEPLGAFGPEAVRNGSPSGQAAYQVYYEQTHPEPLGAFGPEAVRDGSPSGQAAYQVYYEQTHPAPT